jgi:hypothetical protein
LSFKKPGSPGFFIGGLIWVLMLLKLFSLRGEQTAFAMKNQKPNKQ